MIRTLARVVSGFALACLIAGLVQVFFARPPGGLLGAPASVFAERAADLGVLILLAATHAAIFAAAFGLIAAGIGEWTGTRAMAYYLFAGTVIALLGFFAQYSSEAPGQATVFNNYALKAYLTSGFFAGLAYWLVAGRGAGGPDEDAEREAANEEHTIGVPPPARTWKTRPRLIIEDAPKPGSKDSKKASLAERLEANTEPDVQIARKDTKADLALDRGAVSPARTGAEQYPHGAKPSESPATRTGTTTSVPTTKPGQPAKTTDSPNSNDPGKKA